jgi:predicted metal-binding membrane protein
VTPQEGPLSAILKHENLIVGSALFLLTLLAWISVIWLAGQMQAPMPGMSEMPGMDRGALTPGFAPWSLIHFFFIFAMWSVMMIGMMTPSASPMIFIYGQVARQARTLGRAFAPPGWFAAGYLSSWTLFALAATAAQYGLERAALLTPMLASANKYFSGGVLIAAGLYQWMPLKDSCLTQCRAPLSFVQRHGGFQPRALGSLRLGVLHGAYCIGCCGTLMALLFVAGVMNLLWIAALMIFVLAEKVIPGGRLFGRLAGIAAFACGVWSVAA